MFRNGRFVLFLLLMVSCVGCAAIPREREYFYTKGFPDFSDAFDSVKESVVWIRALKRVKSGDSKEEYILAPSNGSGVIIESRELPGGNFESNIITNYHVASNTEKLVVHLYPSGSRSYRAEIIRFDDFRDLALLRIVTPNKLTPVTLGDPRKLRIGTAVYAVGNPAGLTWSLSVGFIGNLDKDPLLETVQFDGAFNPGSSGGGLFNTRGELIGIPFQTMSNSLGFAISANVVKRMLVAQEKGGRVQNGFFGVSVIDIYDLTESMAKHTGITYPLPVDYGVVVGGVLGNMPAAKAGILVGDIILELGGKGVESGRHFQKLSAESKIGKETTLKILRGDREMALRITPVERPAE